MKVWNCIISTSDITYFVISAALKLEKPKSVSVHSVIEMSCISCLIIRILAKINIKYVWPPLYIFVHIWNRISRMLYIGHELDFTLSQTRSNTNTIQIQCKIFWPTETTIYCKSFNVQLKKYLFCINQANKRAIKLNSLAISMNFTFTMVVKGLYP